MVSKAASKRTPTKSIKNLQHRRHRKRSPGKSATLIANINKSIITCQRRLAKLFSKLARIATPTAANCRNKRGFQILQKEPNSQKAAVCRVLHLDGNERAIARRLPPPFTPHKRTVFLDLDETLVHSSSEQPTKRFDFVVRPTIEGEVMTFYVLKRPGLEAFMEGLSSRYEVVVFTAGLKEYASLVLDRIDKKGLISHRLYRDSCREVDGKYVKDLAETGRDLDKVVIVDDNPNAYFLHPENAVPVKAFVDDMGDRELEKLMRFFDGFCDGFEDMRDAVKQFVYVDDDQIQEGGKVVNCVF
ncbi:NIF domain-containing protein [Cephalotus follicularis]|uniref:NIF domain-containing protein n=1 Tax=Cephalotus follicularis TaxID=3775 RepID=A0A1Q3D828_CEPFO|nr:NIF domain-containing protein [Cephalotus follicularis]